MTDHDYSRPSTGDVDAYVRNGGRRDHRRERIAGNDNQARRSLGDLFQDLTSEVQTLVHQEVQLAKTELSEKASAVGKDLGFLIGGGLFAYAGLIICLMAVGLFLASFMPDWLGFLCAGLIVVVVGGAILKKGLSGVQETKASLEKTVESIDETKQWLKEEASDIKRDPAHLGSHR